MHSGQTLKATRENVAALAKEVNLKRQRTNKETPVRVTELNFDGFLDFLLQAAHQYFNTKTADDGHFEFNAVQLLEKLIALLKDTNKMLRLPVTHFKDESDETIPDVARSRTRHHKSQSHRAKRVPEFTNRKVTDNSLDGISEEQGQTS